MLNELMTLFGGLSPDQQMDAMKYSTNAIGKLGLTLGKVFGYFYEPKHIKQMADAESYKRKKMAEAKAYEIETVGDAIKKEDFLPLVYNSEDGTMTVDISDSTQLIQRSELRLRYSQIQKEHNIESVIGKTALELEGKDANIDEEVDKDWLNRYFNIVEDISDEDMQNLWARILAGEILKPRSYSLRLLDFLHNTSKEELDRILKILPFAVFDGFIIKNEEELKNNNIYFGDFLFYSEIGILHSNNEVGNKYEIPALEKDFLIYYSDQYACFANNKNNESQKFNFSIYSMTSLGLELLKLARISINQDYLVKNMNIWGSKYRNIHFMLFKVKSLINKRIECEDNPIFEINKE